MKDKLMNVAIGLVLGMAAWTFVKSGQNDFPAYKYQVVQNDADPIQVIKSQEERLATRPDSALEMSTLASLYMAHGQKSGDFDFIDKAEKLARLSHKSLPFSNTQALIVLAEVHESRHQFDEAIVYAEKVLKESPTNEGALSVIVTASMGKGDLEKSEQAATRWTAQRPSRNSMTLLGLVQLAQGKESEGIQSFKKAIALEDIGESEGASWTRAMLARYFLHTGALNKAQTLLKESLRLQPQDPTNLMLMGALHEKLGDDALALSYAEEAWSISGEPHAILAGARIYEKSGDHIKAERARREAEVAIREEMNSGPYGHPSELMTLLVDRGDKASLLEAVQVGQSEVKKRKDARTMLLLAEAYQKMGALAQMKEVIRTLHETGARDPRITNFSFSRSRQLAKVGWEGVK